MLHRLEELAGNREDLAFESTLAGRLVYNFLRRRLLDGYACHLCYLWLPSPDMAVARVRSRVEAGGHDVPEPTIRRRFWRSLLNFDRLYRPMVTVWQLYDGSALVGRPLIASGQGAGVPVVQNEATWRTIRDRIDAME